jgi:predicted DNA binding CopG/RHH family protein
VNAKPRALVWLEQQTGADIPHGATETTGKDRHLSVRMPAEDAERLGKMAAERGMTLSQLVRSVLVAALAEHSRAHDTRRA